MRKYAVISIVTMFLSGCGDFNDYRYYTMPEEELAQVERNPAAYTGTLLAFEGRVLQADENDDGTFFQILVGDSHSSLTVVFLGKGTRIAREHTVSVLGYPGGKVSGINAFGGVVSSVTFMAIAVYDCSPGYYSKGWYITGKEDVYARWASGELFKPKVK